MPDAVWVFGLIASFAAAIKGIEYLARKGKAGFRLIARAGKAIGRLAAIGDEATWPNGSTDLGTFLCGLHTKLGDVQEKVGRVEDQVGLLNHRFDQHEARHIDIDAELERRIG